MARVSPDGFGERQASLSFHFDGRLFPAAPGETIAAALAAAGELALRDTRAGELRGPFCGMGVCHECLVAADGETVRACMTPVRGGMAIVRHHPRLARTTPQRKPERTEALHADVAVVGGGPAGLAAAIAAARSGRDVVIIDERKQPGGQYYKQPPAEFPLSGRALDAQFREGRDLVETARGAGARFLKESAVWATHAGSLLLDTADGARRLDAKRIILATGAAERCPPFPGWTLPGVLTTGAAQSFLRAYGVSPGARVLIAGAGPLNLQLAAALAGLGIAVIAVVEASSRPGVSNLPALARMVAAAPRLVGEGLRYRLALARAGVPVIHQSVILDAEGGGRVRRARIGKLGQDRKPDVSSAQSFDCDLLCVGYGFNPAVELAASMGCALRYDKRWRHLAVETDDDGRTSLPGVFAVGDGARFGGSRVALAQGSLAGFAAARDLADAGGGRNGPETARARVELARAWRFQEALWSLYDAPVLTHELAETGTLVCRCEHVTHGMVTDAIDAGATGLGAIKRATRLGMGRCQGRYCAGTAAAMLSSRNGSQTQPDDFFAPRTPLRPVSIGAAASLDLRMEQ